MTYTPPATRAYGYKIGAAADWNILVQDLDDHEARLQALEASGGVTQPTNIPVGGIILWSGSVASIPAHFALCDGNNGTPDLRDRFVIGAGNSYAPGATGGATTHLHSGGSIGDAGSHSHSYSSNTGGPSGTASALSGGVSVASSGHSHSFSGNTGSAGSHGHSIGNTGSASSMPPYYALAYIMRTD